MVTHDDQVLMLDKFMKAARGQIGDKYRFGARASADDADPKAFDSSELVEWAAHRAGLTDMPDGSWQQYRYLERQDATVDVKEALRTPGALVFGFSSDPMTSPDRPARAYVAISVGDGKNVIDVSERAGEVKVMPAGDFYNYGAKIPDLHGLPDSIGIDTNGDGIPDASLPRPRFDDEYDSDGDGIPDSSRRPPLPPGEADTDGDGLPDSSVRQPDDPWSDRRDRGIIMDRNTTVPGPAMTAPDDDDPVVPSAPGGSGSSSQLLREDPLGADEPEATASYADEPLPDEAAWYPADDGVAAAPAEPALTPAAPTTAYADSPTYADAPAYADSVASADDTGYGAPADADPYADSSTDLSADA